MNADDDPPVDDASGAPDEREAIAAFEHLGLTNYEAQVFIALQRLGTGTARDVARVADVPRSQVYSVAENLEERGLLSVQQSSPIRYRPVSVEAASEILRDRFEREQERAFEYVESVNDESTPEEHQEDIWTVRDSARVDERVVELLETADERVVFGARLPELVTDEIERTIADRAADGLEASVVSTIPAIRDRFASLEGVDAAAPPEHRERDDRSGRLVIGDDDAVLLSVVDEEGCETAIWSTDSLFASVLVQLIEGSSETGRHR